MESDSLRGKVKFIHWQDEFSWLIKGKRFDTRKYGYIINAQYCPTKDWPETR